MWNELLISAREAAYAGTLFLGIAAAGFFSTLAVLLAILRFVDPPTSAVMLRDHLRGARIQHAWTPIEAISPHLVDAVISSEDTRFCSHSGFDWTEIGHAVDTAEQHGLNAVRGASTITMQVAKNLFLWTDRSFARKGLEIAITPVIELMWPKRRIIEVYLNIAQWGPGLFGAGVAARHHFDRDARALSPDQAALLTAALPAPSVRRPGDANAFVRRIAKRIRARMRSGNVDAACVFGPAERRIRAEM